MAEVPADPLPSFVYVSRGRPLAAGPILVNLLIQRQRQGSVSNRQTQHQRLLGNRDGLIGSTHVFLGVVKALDRLEGRGIRNTGLKLTEVK